MQKTNINPLILSFSILALSSVLMHSTRIDSATTIANIDNDNQLTNQTSSNIAKDSDYTHVSTLSFSGDTFNIRSQPPSARPREDDENDQKSNNQFIHDDFVNIYSMSST